MNMQIDKSTGAHGASYKKRMLWRKERKLDSYIIR